MSDTRPIVTFDGPVQVVRTIHVYDDQGVEVWTHDCQPGETSVQMPPGVVEPFREYRIDTELEWVKPEWSAPEDFE